MIVSSLKTKNMDFRYPQGMYFPQKYYRNRPQGRPHEKESELFGTEKEKLELSLVSILL